MAQGALAERVERIESHFDWRDADLRPVLQSRLDRLRMIRDKPGMLPSLRAYYRDHLDDWISDWGMTYDPRNVARGRIADVPFVLFPKQREWVQWAVKNWRDLEYGGTPKSRDVGISWLFVALSLGMATLFDGVTVGWGSFKQDKVDKPGDIGSLFEKGRYYLDHLPTEFRGGYVREDDSRERLLRFPASRSSIIGEVGDNIGRGGRTSIYFVDETAYLEHDTIVDMALSKNTQCRIDVSSVRGMQNTFAERMHDGISRQFVFHWRDNPMFTQADYDKFRAQWGAVTTAQELDIDYAASVEGIIIPSEWVQEAIDAHKKLNLTPSGIKRAALDVADQGRDLNALIGRYGILVHRCETWSGGGSYLYETTEKAFLYCDQWQLDGFDYDADGMGAGVRGDAARISTRRREQRLRRIDVGEFRGSAAVLNPDRRVEGTDRTAGDMFQNLKAQSWYNLMCRFRETHRALAGHPYDADMIVSLDSTMPALSKLCGELSQPQWKISGTGKLMVDKVPDGKASPNMADAVMMVFAQQRGLRINPLILTME